MNCEYLEWRKVEVKAYERPYNFDLSIPICTKVNPNKLCLSALRELPEGCPNIITEFLR